MAVIRQAAATRVSADAIVLDLGDLSRQGDEVRARAQADARAILTQAAAERQKLISGAREEGVAKGYAEGLAQGSEKGRLEGAAAAVQERRAELDALIAGWTKALKVFDQAREGMLLEAREDVVRLAVMMGERVTRRKIEVDAGVVAAEMEGVLALISRPTRLTVQVHPEDEALAREAAPGLMAVYAQVKHIEVKGDAGLERGSCIARTATGGVIDASIPTQLDRMARALLPLETGTDSTGGGP